MIAALVAFAALLSGGASAQSVAAERVGDVAKLPAEMGSHWVWASDSVLNRSALFDADSGRMLGMVDGGVGVSPLHPLISRARREVYVVETVYSRGHRGERTDLVTIYDAVTLAVVGEVVIPPRRADNGNGVALAALLDGDRFLVVLNQNPGTSVSVVDLEARAFAGEIATPGCALVLPAGERRFGMLCGDGTARGDHARRGGARGQSHEERALLRRHARSAHREGRARRPALALRIVRRAPPRDRLQRRAAARRPRPGLCSRTRSARRAGGSAGMQHLALHVASSRLYSVVHQGEAGSHKDPGPEVWVYDLAKRARVQRIELGNLTAAFLRPLIGIEAGGVADTLLRALVPSPGADTLAVTRDDAPLLFAGERESGAVGVYDAKSGRAPARSRRDRDRRRPAGGAVSLDPALDLALRAGLAVLFAASALAKLRDRAGFAAAVAGYRLLPERLAPPAATAFVAAELALAGALCAPSLRVAAAVGAAGLLLLYAFAIAWNLARGRRDIDCGCGGPFGGAGRQPLSEALVAPEPGARGGGARERAARSASRALGWLDLWTTLAALASGALLYAAANTLLARPVPR